VCARAVRCGLGEKEAERARGEKREGREPPNRRLGRGGKLTVRAAGAAQELECVPDYEHRRVASAHRGEDRRHRWRPAAARCLLPRQPAVVVVAAGEAFGRERRLGLQLCPWIGEFAARGGAKQTWSLSSAAAQAASGRSRRALGAVPPSTRSFGARGRCRPDRREAIDCRLSPWR
jgi:hypothetical protein